MRGARSTVGILAEEKLQPATISRCSGLEDKIDDLLGAH